LLSTQFEQLLRLLEEFVLLLSDLLFDLVLHVLRLLEFALSHCVHLFELVLSGEFFAETLFRGGELLLRSVKALHLLSKHCVDIRHVGALVVQFSRECGQLVFEDCNLTLQCRFSIFLH